MSILALMYSHTFCRQNQNQFDLKFFIIINMLARETRRGRSMSWPLSNAALLQFILLKSQAHLTELNAAHAVACDVDAGRPDAEAEQIGHHQ